MPVAARSDLQVTLTVAMSIRLEKANTGDDAGGR